MPVLRTGSGGGGHVSQSVTEQNRCTRTSTGKSSRPARRAVDIHAQGVVIQGFWSWASELSPAVVNARRKALNWNLELTPVLPCLPIPPQFLHQRCLLHLSTYPCWVSHTSLRRLRLLRRGPSRGIPITRHCWIASPSSPCICMRALYRSHLCPEARETSQS
jgi:hypothetical protein